jgi:hypothetical protein
MVAAAAGGGQITPAPQTEVAHRLPPHTCALGSAVGALATWRMPTVIRSKPPAHDRRASQLPTLGLDNSIVPDEQQIVPAAAAARSGATADSVISTTTPPSTISCTTSGAVPEIRLQPSPVSAGDTQGCSTPTLKPLSRSASLPDRPFATAVGLQLSPPPAMCAPVRAPHAHPSGLPPRPIRKTRSSAAQEKAAATTSSSVSKSGVVVATALSGTGAATVTAAPALQRMSSSCATTRSASDGLKLTKQLLQQQLVQQQAALDSPVGSSVSAGSDLLASSGLAAQAARGGGTQRGSGEQLGSNRRGRVGMGMGMMRMLRRLARLLPSASTPSPQQPGGDGDKRDVEALTPLPTPALPSARPLVRSRIEVRVLCWGTRVCGRVMSGQRHDCEPLTISIP